MSVKDKDCILFLLHKKEGVFYGRENARGNQETERRLVYLEQGSEGKNGKE